MATLKITGIDEDTARFVAERTKRLHFKGQAEYLRDLIRRDRLATEAQSKREIGAILAPIHAHSESQGYTDAQLSEFFEVLRQKVAAPPKP